MSGSSPVTKVEGLHSISIFKQGGTTPAPSSDTIIGSGKMYISGDAEVVNSSILINSSHGNAAMLAQSTAWLTASSVNAGFSTAAGAGSTVTEQTIWNYATRVPTSLPGTVTDLDTLQANIMGGGGTAHDLTKIHGETSAMSTILANSSHGNAGLLTGIVANFVVATAIQAETSAIKAVVENSSHGNAALLTRGNTAWLTASSANAASTSAAVEASIVLPEWMSTASSCHDRMPGAAPPCRVGRGAFS